MDNRKLTAILFADIVGYTTMMQEDEHTATIAVRKFQSAMKKRVEEFNGRIVNFYGDGALCLFDIPLLAVRSAMAIQAEFNLEPKIPVRIGIHSGTVTFEGDKVFGDSINVASRIESAALPGSILLSKKVRDDVKNNPDLKITALGNYNFKNVQEPVEVYAITNEGLNVPKGKILMDEFKEMGGKKSAFTRILFLIPILLIFGVGITYLSTLIGRKQVDETIAVLPLINLNSEDENLEYFSDGVTQEIIDELAKINSISVTAFTTALLYKKRTKPNKEVAAELDVNYIVSGSSRIGATGDSVKLSIELIEPKSQKIIWNGTYNEGMQNAPKLQLSIAKQIAATLDIDLSKEEQQALNEVNTESGEAFQLFLKAKGEMAKLSVDGLDNAEGHLQKAVEIDPEYAQAFTLLAWNYVLQGWRWFWRGNIPIHEASQRALVAINKAIELDPESSDIYLVRANYNATFDANVANAIKDVEHALALNSWPEIPTNYCICTAVTTYAIAGKIDKAKKIANLATKVDPGNLFIYHDQGVIYMQEGKMLQAQSWFQKAVDIANLPVLNFFLAWSFYHNQQYEESISHFENYRINDTLNVSIHLAYLSNVYYHLNQSQKSEEYLNQLLGRYKNEREALNMPLAIIAAAQGSDDETLTYLEKSLYNKEPMITYLINLDPSFRHLYDNPRFKEIRRKMEY